jgi:putative DNA primase/helicase
MATNHKPVIQGTDHGIWRRIKLIPFTTRIEDEKQDKFLEGKLKQEASGILNWILEGSKRWTVERLKAPKIVTAATDEYRSEMDIIGIFLSEACRHGEECEIMLKDLYRGYCNWCDENNEHPQKERVFSGRLKELKYKQGRSGQRYWKGICLLE